MGTWLRHIWLLLRSSYWFVPGTMLLGSVLAAWRAIRVDQLRPPPEWINSLAYAGSIEGARQVLATLASSAITVAGVAFSITVATLSQASSQFGPRILRNFMHDLGNQIVLGTFTATFTFCILVLRTVRAPSEIASFAPHFSVTCAVSLGVCSICVLIYFIHHVAKSLQAPNVVAAVRRELVDTIAHRYPDALGDSGPEPPEGADQLEQRMLREGAPVWSTRAGYIQSVDQRGLMQLAQSRDLVIWLRCRPGDFLLEGAPLLLVHPRQHATKSLASAFQELFILGNERTSEQDIEHTINQMVEIGVRALSPGINDPFTAITCVDWLGQSLREIATHDMHKPFRYDSEGKLRVVARLSTFEGLVGAAFNQLRQNTASHISVSIRMLEVIALLGPRISKQVLRAPLREHAEMIYRQQTAASTNDRDKAALRARYEASTAALAGDPDAMTAGPKGRERE